MTIATSVFTMVIWSFGFFRMGTAGIVAQLLGKKDYREIIKTLLRNLLAVGIISILIFLCKPLILLLTKTYFSASPETHNLVKTYMSVRILSVPCRADNLYFNRFLFRYSKNWDIKFINNYFVVFKYNIKFIFCFNIKFRCFWYCSWNINCKLYYCIIVCCLYLLLHSKKISNPIPKFEKIIVLPKLLRLFKIN